MTEQLSSDYVASVVTRRRIAVTSLLFTWTLIGLLVEYGDPSNSLHTSALAWSFSTNILVMFAYAFGRMLDKYISK